MKKQFLTGILAAGAMAISFVGQVDRAEAFEIRTFGFRGITNNNATNVTTGESQLFVDVIGNSLTSTQVEFKLYNTGPNPSSITDVYFDNGTLLGIANIIEDGTNVDFGVGASPQTLPGGNAIQMGQNDINSLDHYFTADSESPVQPKGVNPNESVSILFNLINGKTYQDTINAMLFALTKPNEDLVGGLRIGIHVQGFAPGSESFVNSGPIPNPVPTPALIPSLIGVGVAALRKKKREEKMAQEA